MSRSQLSPESEVEQINDRVKWFTFIAVIVTHLLLILCVWGQWRTIVIITATFAVVLAINQVLAQAFFSERTRTAEAIRLVVNLLATTVYGHFTGWALPVWLYLPLNSLWVGNHLERWVRLLIFGLFLLVGSLSILDGVSPLVPLTFMVLSALVYAISGARVRMLRHVLEHLGQRHEELARAHQELDRTHQRAREQDRLSSLGTLAAGIAHEINNPLAYVKSNVNILYRDLQAQKELPEELREYVTEVLPATLDGIQRIATIVADLRRFARGEPEQLVEYDLNAEIEAAVRITQGRVQPQCEVEFRLGPLPRMMGRPRQLAQVVINLLINAAQATPREGKIFLSTWQEGDEVVLEVRDTGEGMTPEVMARLFQPFFSTKPIGVGTGMGLAVVHGIVSAHGGRIQVESQPGKGSTFTIRLPLASQAPLALAP
jgi:signal transduction histidine kinase